MIFEVNGESSRIPRTEWNPSELELEKYLICKSDGSSNADLFDESVFGESLLLLENQAATKQGKRADLVALDQHGNGVFIELKKHEAKQGVETQALQYLANYANLKGEAFLHRFKHAQEAIDQFLPDYDTSKFNSQSRIILVARSFDKSLFSMGEWLSSQGVAFRCIQYVPFKIADRTFLSFSVRFDRSKESLYQLSWEPRDPQFYWHNIAHSPIGLNDHDIDAEDQWWRHHREEGMISASFNNEPGDAGDRILNSYHAQDTVIAYASGYGAIGWGVVQTPTYRLVNPEYDRFSASGQLRHRLKGIQWQHVAVSVSDAIPANELKEKFGLNHPIQTRSKIRRDRAEALVREMAIRFRSAQK